MERSGILNIKKWLNGVCVCIVIVGFFAIGTSVQAGTVYNSPYVDSSPDREDFTTNFQDTNCQWYDADAEVVTGILSSLRKPEEGEHEYRKERRGNIPIYESNR